MLLLPTLLCLTTYLVLPSRADPTLDASRTGSYYSNFPIYRSGSGTNTVKVVVGTPGVEAQLTLSTNVNFIQIASTECSACTNTELYDLLKSSTWATGQQDQVNIVVYPPFPKDTLTFSSKLGTDIVLDARGQDQVPSPVSAVNRIESGRDGAGGGSGLDVSLGGGVSGFYGLGINQEQNRQLSIVATMLNADQYPPNQPVPKSFIVGFDIDPYINQAGTQVGSMHWGAIPQGKWIGDFNWLECNQTIGGSWGVAIDNIRMGGNVIDTTQLYATLDPGFDGIYLPSRIAIHLFNNVQGVRRDTQNPRRWTIPCNFIQSMSISIQSATYNFNPTQLVQPKDGQTCYSQVQAWTDGSVAEEQGEIRFGTSFMSGVYSAIYFSPNQQFVALAGKPGSVNDLNVTAQGGAGMPNTKLAGILIGTLLGALLILFVICYARNRSSFQSTWARGARRMQRAQRNAVVRHSTIPPPMMGMSGPMMVGGPTHMGYPGAMYPGAMMPMGVGAIGPGMQGSGYPGQIGGYQPHLHQQPILPQSQPLLPPQPLQHAQNPPHPTQQLPSYPTLVTPHHNRAESKYRATGSHPAQPYRHSLPASSSHDSAAYYSPRAHHKSFNPSKDPASGDDRRKRVRRSAPVTQTYQRGSGAALAAPLAGREDSNPGAPGGSGGGGDQQLAARGQLSSSHKESAHPRHHSANPPLENLVASYPSPTQPLYDPTGFDTRHRLSQSEYHHAPPGSATNKSLWNFGKARSIARGYESVPRHASTTFEYRPASIQPVRDARQSGEQSHGRLAGDAAEADIGDGMHPSADWAEVERNREREGLTTAKAWRRK